MYIEVYQDVELYFLYAVIKQIDRLKMHIMRVF